MITNKNVAIYVARQIAKNADLKKEFSKVLNNKNYKKLQNAQKFDVLKAIASGRKLLTTGNNGTAETAGLQFTMKHTGKMTDLVSLSTSVEKNIICQVRQKDEKSICAHCFAQSMMKIYDNLEPVMSRNLDVLCSRLLEVNEIPVILTNSGYFRLESFGDVCNVIQAANSLRIAAANSWLSCAVWTKNPAFYYAAITGRYADKPENMNIILSSIYVNMVDQLPAKYAFFIDHIFTVYDDRGIYDQGININCGARSCASCGKCYKKSFDYFEIYEKLK